ncbi:MAG: prolipoprotein diacylglyceryl transferase [Clostridia bacterium]|nr:prolipoprotein diacylglyceryl transferase [Clostridia bacterium]
MENGMIVLFQAGPFTVTAYGLALVAALALGLALLAFNCKRKNLKENTAFTLAALSLPLGLVCARLFYVLCRISLYGEMGMAEAVKMWRGGYALWGAILGVVLAAAVSSRITKQPLSRLTDALVLPGAAVIALCRFAEALNGEGIGIQVENEALQFFPLAIMNEWEEWYFAVFMAEGLAALAVMLVLLAKKRRAGEDTKVFVWLFCTCSLLLESLRRDQFLRWLFVRVNQLTAVLVLTGFMVGALVKWLKNREQYSMKTGTMIACWVVYTVLAGACIALEFAVDKAAWLPVWACYCLMALCVAGMGLCAYKVLFPGENVKD